MTEAAAAANEFNELPPLDVVEIEAQADAWEAQRGKGQKLELEAAEAGADESEQAAEADTTEDGEQAESDAEGEDKPTLEAIRAMAEKLGLSVHDNAVVPAERAKFREEKRRFRTEAQKRQADLDRATKEHETYALAAKRKADGDLVGAVEALGIDANEFNRQMAGRVDPAFAERQKIQKELAELRQQREREAEARKRAEEQASYQQICGEHRQAIAAEWARSDDAQFQNAAKLPLIVERARAISEKVYRDEGENLSGMEAGKLALRELRTFYEGLHPVFSGTQAPRTPASDRDTEDNPETATSTADRSGAASAKPNGKKPPKSVSQRRAADASATKSKPLDHDAWVKEWATRLEAADD